jgi:hypothetical protein
MLDWPGVEARISAERAYWLATSNPNGSPHVTPMWAVWIEDALYFDGPPTARWARNLIADSRVSMNLQSGADAVIIEGLVDDLETDAALGEQIVAAWMAKYGSATLPEPVHQGLFRLRPRKVKAWSESLSDGAVWTFG